MCGRNKAGFELRRCEVDAAFQTSVEKFRERLQIAALRAGKIDNRSTREEETKHRTNAMKGDVALRLRDGVSGQLFELRAEIFEKCPAVDTFKLLQLRETCRHR